MLPVLPIFGCVANLAAVPKRIRANGGMRIVARDVVPDVGAILDGLGRPDDDHAGFVAILPRRTAKEASTSSFDWPRPARIETRPASTLRRR